MHSNESACRKKVRPGLEQVISGQRSMDTSLSEEVLMMEVVAFFMVDTFPLGVYHIIKIDTILRENV